jgi:uncharacterized membrane protein
VGKLVAVVLVVVLVGLVAGGAFWYLRTHAGPAPVGPLPGQALVLPADTVLLAGLDVKALVASATYRHLAAGDIPSLGQALPPEEAEAAKKELREGIQKGLREVEEKVGLRLDRDLDRVVLAASDVEASEPGYALLAWGRFDQAKLVGAVKASAEAEGGTLTASTVEGTAVHVASEKGKAVAALAFLDDATLVAGQAGVVEAIVRSQARRERPLESSPSLIALVGGLDPASGYWAAADRPLVDRMQKEAGEAPVAAPLPRTLTLAGTFDGGLELAGEMADATAAKDLADLLQGGLAALRMQLRQRAELRAVPGATALLDGVLVKAEGAKVTLSAPGGGGGAGLAGVAGAIAVPSLLRARSSANESAAIGDLRTVISAQAAYQSANGGFYGEMACLAQPKLCIVGYEGPHFLDPELASATERSGYRRAFHPGPPAGTPRSLAGYAYTAVPAQPGQTGLRSFCGDASGMICFDPTGADVVPENGACPSTCVALQ